MAGTARDREPEAMARLDAEHAAAIHDVVREQAQFNRDWRRMRDAASAHGIQLFGDIPFFVAHDSADVWARPTASCSTHRASRPSCPAFHRTTSLKTVSVGARRCTTGRRTRARRSRGGRRMQRMFDLFDVVRIDHFRAVDSAWAIPADHLTARDGAWTPGPGDALLEAIRAPEGKHLVAEDLGIIPQACSSCATVTGCRHGRAAFC